MAAAAAARSDRLMTEEQRAVVDCAKPPDTKPVPAAVRVTAGAGTGKTTVLEEVVAKLGRLGHKRGQYVAFGSAAAGDATARMTKGGALPLGGGLSSGTADSCARRCLKEAVGDDPAEPMPDSEFKKKVLELCLDDIRHTITGEAVGLSPPRMRRLERLVGNLIYKTLESCFMYSSLTLEKGFDAKATYPSHVYYPALQWHDRKSRQLPPAPEGVPPLSEKIKQFYLMQAKKIWALLDDPDDTLSTHSSVMKQAQLKKLAIPGTFLLVDEVQDLNPCQLDWFIQQHKQGTHVFFVGDLAQQIYSFRGAKCGPLLDYTHAQDLELTASFRFGENIATIANAILFSKLKSKQTSVKDAGFRSANKQRLWRPYVLKGQALGAGQVGWQLSAEAETAQPACSLMDGRGKVTLLARANHTLMKTCLPRVLASLEPGKALLKVAVNGKGQGSGLGKWNVIIREVGHFATLWDLSGPTVDLDRKKAGTLPFEEFQGETDLTWDGARDIIEEQELGKFRAVLAIVEQYKGGTRDAMAKFKEHVLDKKYTQEEADVVLSTVHSAKGMEWDNVELCDDLSMLSAIKVVGCDQRGLPERRASFNSASSPKAMFDFADYGDDLNMWYVAVTRAKRRLSLPSQFKQLVDDFRSIAQFAASAANASPGAAAAATSPSASQPEEVPDSPGGQPLVGGYIRIQGQTIHREDAKLIVRTRMWYCRLGFRALLQEGHGSWASGDWLWAEQAPPQQQPLDAAVATGAASCGIRVKRELESVAAAVGEEDGDVDVCVTGVVTNQDRAKRARHEAEDLT